MEVGGVAVGVQMKSMERRWAVGKRCDYGKLNSRRRRKLPVYISANPSDISPLELRDLYSTCNHSCHRFPNLDHNGKVLEAVDLNKLRVALSHSSVLVSVFCNLEDLEPQEEALSLMGLGDFLRKVTPFPLLSPSNSQLVGFGRAVSDLGMTASIHDVMVIPSLRGMGIGKIIVNKIIRILTNRDIYDIAALCSANESNECIWRRDMDCIANASSSSSFPLSFGFHAETFFYSFTRKS
ncbi:uncharacterized protein LOC8276639 isoform X2 [Ricinus communis]|uniref:uncharacterized protein LOC8276639 isoform X2 n=1 Tax=Ricinus communis TaxID=3988 RepID=UPI00201B08E5|nr:uncharacterized protein LOC8276639 isoform X2 [Ricinus communis]